MKSNLVCGTLVMVAVIFSVSPAHAEGEATVNKLVIHADKPGAQINRNIYGQFSEHLGHCVYGGIWVGEDSPIPNTRGIRNDVIAALKKIKVPVVRWPGGCFADEYHWKDGIGPKDKRPRMVNTAWGGVVEDNHFGTHEFLDFCEQIGAAPYLCGNVGSGTVQELMEWIEYITSDSKSPMADLRRENGHARAWKLPFLAVGNESWGCGGNMTPEFYADNYRRFNTFVKNLSGNKIYRVAGGPSDSNYEWTEVLMKTSAKQMDGLSLHYYSLPSGSWKGNKGPATNFSEAEWHSTLLQTLRIEEFVTKHSIIMDKYDPENHVGLIVDEWGTWYDSEPGTMLYQQNTLRDALVAGVNLNIFNRHAERVKMANIAQLANVLQSMVLTDNEKFTVTPTYHVFEMYTVHQDATLLPADLQTPDYVIDGQKVPDVSVSASRDKSGKIHVSLCNLNPNQPAQVACELDGAKAQKISGRVLTDKKMDARNTFEHPDALQPVAFSEFKINEKGFSTTLPAKSVVVLELE